MHYIAAVILALSAFVIACWRYHRNRIARIDLAYGPIARLGRVALDAVAGVAPEYRAAVRMGRSDGSVTCPHRIHARARALAALQSAVDLERLARACGVNLVMVELIAGYMLDKALAEMTGTVLRTQVREGVSREDAWRDSWKIWQRRALVAEAKLEVTPHHVHQHDALETLS